MANFPTPLDPSSGAWITAALDSGEQLLQLIGKALHDGLCQELGAALIQLRVLQEGFRVGHPLSASDLESLAGILQKTAKAARSIEGRLRPFDSTPGGLMAGLARLASEASAQVPCRFICEEPVLCADAGRSLLLFRVAEEAVQAALQRPARTAVEIALKLESAQIEVSVEDFGPADFLAEGKNLGISRSRAEMGGARWQWDPNSQGGLRVACQISLPSDPPNAD